MSESFALNGGPLSASTTYVFTFLKFGAQLKFSKCDFEEFLIALLSFSGVNNDVFLNVLKDL